MIPAPRDVIGTAGVFESPAMRVWIAAVSALLPAKVTRGTATITAGNTTVTVTHGLGSTPAYVTATPGADPGSRFWVSSKGATTFVINLSSAAGGSVAFDWRAETQ